MMAFAKLLYIHMDEWCVCVCLLFHGAEVNQTVLSALGELVVLQQSVLKGHAVDVVPAGHQPHHRVITADLHLGWRGRGKRTL